MGKCSTCHVYLSETGWFDLVLMISMGYDTVFITVYYELLRGVREVTRLAH